MSVDLAATVRVPTTLAAVVDRARGVLSTLLDLPTVPDLVIVVDRPHQQGARTGPDRRPDVVNLGATVIGHPMAPDGTGAAGVPVKIDVPATGDGVRLMEIDLHDPEFGAFDDDRRAVVSPGRTCVGVTMATGVALAVAQLARGEFLDDEIRMLRPAVRDPDQVIGRTRLRGAEGDFAARCEEYLRQFPDLGGWPRDRSTAWPPAHPPRTDQGEHRPDASE